MNLGQYYDYLIDYELVSEEALDIITSINGYNEKTLDDVLYCVSGYRGIEEYLEYEDIENYNLYYNDDESEDDFDEL